MNGSLQYVSGTGDGLNHAIHFKYGANLNYAICFKYGGAGIIYAIRFKYGSIMQTISSTGLIMQYILTENRNIFHNEYI